MDLVCSGFGHNRQRAGRRISHLCVKAVGNHPEFANRVLAEARTGQSQRLIGKIRAVHYDSGLGRVAAGANDR